MINPQITKTINVGYIGEVNSMGNSNNELNLNQLHADRQITAEWLNDILADVNELHLKVTNPYITTYFLTYEELLDLKTLQNLLAKSLDGIALYLKKTDQLIDLSTEHEVLLSQREKALEDQEIFSSRLVEVSTKIKLHSNCLRRIKQWVAEDNQSSNVLTETDSKLSISPPR